MKTNLMEYLPGVFQGIREYRTITAVQDADFDRVKTEIANVLKNQYVSELDKNGCKRYEKILGVKPMDTDTIEERRFRILTRVNEQLPYTIRGVSKRLSDLCGEDGYIISMDKERYILEVKVALAAKKNIEAVTNLMERITPCNLILSVTLLYNTHEIVSAYTHDELSDFLHSRIREEEF